MVNHLFFTGTGCSPLSNLTDGRIEFVGSDGFPKTKSLGLIGIYFYLYGKYYKYIMIMKKEKLIKKIQQLLDELGTREISVHELDTETQIGLGELANGDIVEQVETLRYDDVATTVYHNGIEIDWSDKDYRDLPLETLEVIVESLQYYKIDFDKTLDVIRDEDF